MRNPLTENIFFYLVIAFGLFSLFPVKGYAWEFRFSGDISEYFYIDKNFLEITDIVPVNLIYVPVDPKKTDLYFLVDIYRCIYEFSDDTSANIITFNPEFYFSKGKGFSGYLGIGGSWLHYWDGDEGQEDDLELSNAYLSLSSGKMFAQIGIQPFVIGGGLILGDYEPGISLGYRTTSKFYYNLEAAIIFKNSSLAALSIGYEPGFLEKIELFSAWFHDADDAFAEMLAQLLCHNFSNMKGRGDLAWVGLDFDLFLGNIYLTGTIIGQYGQYHITTSYDSGDFLVFNRINNNEPWVNDYVVRTDEADLILQSYLIHLKADYNITDWLSIGAFFFFSPGSSLLNGNRLKDTPKIFISPRPYPVQDSLFFSGGFSPTVSPDALSLGAMSHNGVVAPGLMLGVEPQENISLEITFNFFFPERNPYPDDRWYGYETDVGLSYRWTEKHKIFLEAAFFQHGNFYEASNPDPIFRIGIGYNVFF